MAAHEDRPAPGKGVECDVGAVACMHVNWTRLEVQGPGDAREHAPTLHIEMRDGDSNEVPLVCTLSGHGIPWI